MPAATRAIGKSLSVPKNPFQYQAHIELGRSVSDSPCAQAMCIEYMSGASSSGRLEARPWLGGSAWRSNGPASSGGGPWRSACSGGGRRGHGTLAAGGTATEAGGARTNKNWNYQMKLITEIAS